MATNYDELMSEEQDVHTHPDHNFQDRVKLAGDVLPGRWTVDPSAPNLSDSALQNYPAELARQMGHMGARGARALGADADKIRPISPRAARILRGFEP